MVKSPENVNENHKLVKWNHNNAIHNYEEYIQLLCIQLMLVETIMKAVLKVKILRNFQFRIYEVKHERN